MLNLVRRIAKMLPTFSGRVEFHGENEVPSITLSIEFAIDEDELDVILGKGAHDALFVAPAATAVEPRFKSVSELRVDDKFEDARATLWVGLEPTEIKLGPCDVKDLVLTPSVGGMTQCRCKILASPDLSEHLAVLFAAMNHSIEMELLDAKVAEKRDDKQSNLNLAGGGSTAGGASLPPAAGPAVAVGDSLDSAA
jgi:hypothetical protein